MDETLIRRKLKTFVGLRTIKTALAVMVSLIISSAYDFAYPFFTVIASLIVMQNSISASYNSGINRMIGTIFGGITGIFFVMLLRSETMYKNIFFIGLGILFIVSVMNFFDINKGINISLIVFSAISMSIAESDVMYYSMLRIIDTLIGILIALCINIFIFPPNTGKDLLKSYDNLLGEEIKQFTTYVKTGSKISKEKIADKLTHTETIFKIYMDDSKLYMGNIIHDTDRKGWRNITRGIQALEWVYMHLSVMEDIGINGNFDETNAEFFYKITGEKMKSDTNSTNSKKDAIYNYHISHILKNLDLGINYRKKISYIK